MMECSLEVLHRLPAGVVEKDTASAYPSMKLCGGVTWLVPHPISISCSRRQQVLNILGATVNVLIRITGAVSTSSCAKIVTCLSIASHATIDRLSPFSE